MPAGEKLQVISHQAFSDSSMDSLNTIAKSQQTFSLSKTRTIDKIFVSSAGKKKVCQRVWGHPKTIVRHCLMGVGSGYTTAGLRVSEGFSWL